MDSIYDQRFYSINGYLLCQQHFLAMDRLRETIDTYDVRNAQLAVHADRDVLCSFIDEIFREDISSSGGNDSGLDAFNRWVKTKVPMELPVRGPKSMKVFRYKTQI